MHCPQALKNESSLEGRNFKQHRFGMAFFRCFIDSVDCCWSTTGNKLSAVCFCYCDPEILVITNEFCESFFFSRGRHAMKILPSIAGKR